MDDGYFKLVLLKNDGEYFTTNDCHSKASATNMYNCLRKYYAWNCGGNPNVNATFYDADGFEVDSPVIGGSGVYYIHSVTLRENMCIQAATVVKTTSTSTISFDLSKDVQLSSPPLRGSFKFECTDS
jgi:hypothetical protein